MLYSTVELLVRRVFLYFLYLFLICSLVFNVSNGIPSYCSGETVDCTFQLGHPDLPRNSCLVHQTNTCRSMAIPSVPSLRQLESEDEAPFEVALTPYVLLDNIDYQYAVNLSLESNDNDVTGFFFFLQQRESYNSCRVFDFSQAKRILPDQKINLYYECYSGFQSAQEYNYNVIVRAIPINQELKFRTYIPTFGQVEFDNICDWVPLVMLNTAGNYQRKVDLKFSAIGSEHKIEHYIVKLSSKEEEIVKNVPFSLPKGKKMHRVVFEDLPGGKYDLVIAPDLTSIKCPEKVIINFVLPPKPDIPTFPWYYILLCGLLLAVFLAIAYFSYKRLTDQVLSRPKVIILYSEDCPRHKDVVLKLHEFLKYCCSLDVVLDKWDLGNQNPEDWTATLVQEVDFIILVVSKGVKHKADNDNNPEMIEKSPWGDLFLLAYRWLFREVSNNSNDHRLIKVVFTPYCQHSLIPKKLKNVGKTFDLMKDMNSFLCHVHGKSINCGLKQLFHVMPGSQYKSYPKGVELQEAIDAMTDYQDSNPDWFKGQLRETPNPCPPPESPTTSDESFSMSSIKDETHELLVMLSK